MSTVESSFFVDIIDYVHLLLCTEVLEWIIYIFDD